MEAEAIFWAALLIVFGFILVAKLAQLRETSPDKYPTDINGNPIVPASRRPALKREIEDLRARVQLLEGIVSKDRTASPAAEIERPRGRP